MLHLVYIGRYERTIEHFSKQVKESFYHVLTYAKATKIIDKIREKYDIIILFEQTDIQKDILDIEYLRKKYPGIYMVLVMDSLTKEESLQYLKAGINNTIPFEAPQEAIESLINFPRLEKMLRYRFFRFCTDYLVPFVDHYRHSDPHGKQRGSHLQIQTCRKQLSDIRLSEIPLYVHKRR